MKALSLWQPWASLLVAGIKTVETRSWPMRHRGSLLIHAAKKWDPDLATICLGLWFRGNLESIGVRFEKSEAACKAAWGMPLGAMVGRVEVVDCFRTEDVGASLTEVGVAKGPDWRRLDITLRERAFGNYEAGRFAILCRNAVRFKAPVPWRGAQGLFDIPDALLPASVKEAV